MKKITLITLLLASSTLSQAQFFKNALQQASQATQATVQSAKALTGTEEKGVLNLRGPIAPLDLAYANAKTYSISLNLNSNLEASFHSKNEAFALNSFSNNMGISGLKKADAGDLKITYNLTKFEYVNNEDYIEKSYQNAPAYYIGVESNVEIRDKSDKLIYKRYFTPKVAMYVTDPGVSYGTLVTRIILVNYRSLIDEFESYYLNGPYLSNLRYFEAEKRKKSKSTFNAEEFNQSVAVFPTLNDVNRENWPVLFEESQKYWKELVEYKDDKDEDLQRDMRFNANYNLASSYIIIGNIEEAKKYLPAIKENERGFLGVRANYDNLNLLIQDIDAYRASTDRASSIDPIQATPELEEYKKGPNVFRYAEIEGEAMDQDNAVFTGKIRIMSDYPELIDLRTQRTSSGFGQLLDQIGSDKSSVRIYIEGEKKPKKTNLKKLVYIKDKTGKTYFTGKTGKAESLISSGANGINTKRYALFEEVKSSKNLTLVHEFFPKDEYSLKKPSQDEYYSPPVVIGRKKSLRTYFADCPAMIEKINKGEYNFENKAVYIKLYEDYIANCGTK